MDKNQIKNMNKDINETKKIIASFIVMMKSLSYNLDETDTELVLKIIEYIKTISGDDYIYKRKE